MALKEKPIGAQNIEQLSFLWNALLAYFLFLEEVFFFVVSSVNEGVKLPLHWNRFFT
jgi:hypothetical protein